MSAVVEIALPFFAIIFAGYLIGWRKLLGESGIVGLNTFVYYVALPALLFATIARAPVAADFDIRFLIGFYGAGLVVYFLALVSGRVLFRAPLGVSALQGLTATFANVGYMGLPLVIALFGEAAALPAALIVIFDNLILMALTIFLLETDRGGGGALAALPKLATALARNPLILAILAGGAVSLSGLSLPTPIEAFCRLLGNASGPCALFALGATLVGQPVARGAGPVSWFVAIKLIVHPLAVWATFHSLVSIDPVWARVAAVDAALPVAVSVFVLARQYDTHVAPTSTAVLISTAAAVVTVSVLLAVGFPL